MKEVTRLRENDPTFTDLNLGATKPNFEEVKELAKALSRNKYLKTLDFSNNFIGAQGAKMLAKAFERNNVLHTLYLRSNDIGNEGAVAFARVIEVNRSLKNIYLGNNNIESAGITALAEKLSVNHDIEILSFRNNDVGDAACEDLSSDLEINTSLKTLNLANTQITNDGAHSLLKLLKVNTNILEINFNFNEIDHEKIISKIAARLKYNNSQNVMAVNAVAKKIFIYCEEHLTQEEMGEMRTVSPEELSQQYALGKEDLYYLSNKNSHGGAILCISSLYRMALNKYDQAIVSIILKTADSICGSLFSCLKEEMANPSIEKPHEKIIIIAKTAIDMVEK